MFGPEFSSDMSGDDPAIVCHNFNSLRPHAEVLQGFAELDACAVAGQELRHKPSDMAYGGYIDGWNFDWGYPPSVQDRQAAERCGTRAHPTANRAPGFGGVGVAPPLPFGLSRRWTNSLTISGTLRGGASPT